MLRLNLNCKAGGTLSAPLAAVGLALSGVPCAAGQVAVGQVGGVELARRVATMGTACDMEVRCATRGEALAASEAALRALLSVEERLSTWRSTSELARLNAAPVGERFFASAELAQDLALCREWHAATLGAFDPAVGPLVALWDLRGKGRVPTQAELEIARADCGLERAFECEGSSVTRRTAGARLEEGAFGKGLGLDRALAELERRGARGLLDFGGQVATLGIEHEVQLADPRDRGRPVLGWKLAAGSLATSGNSESARVVDGVRVGHILDPRSGRPAADFGSITVHCESAARADAYSTAAFVMGPAEALRWDAARADVELVALCVEGDTLVARAAAELRGTLRPLVEGLRIEFAPEVAVTLEESAEREARRQREKP